MNIVYNLITEVLGGTIDIISAPDKGTRITMVLPCVLPPLP